MQTLLRSDPNDVSAALAGLDLSEDELVAAAVQGYLARTNCTANHPPLFPSFVAWGETVRALREQLAHSGWTRSDEKNYSRTIHPNGQMAIAVATGNEATGSTTDSPCTKSAKGPSTVDALEVNRAQACIPGMEPPVPPFVEQDQTTTWIRLVHHAVGEIRSELSLPLDVGIDGRVSVWRERIILKATPLDLEPIEITPPAQPDIDVVVRRKA
jgi:hypothetical protein